MTADFTMSPFGHLQAVGNIGNNLWTTDLIKNRTAFYSEARRISGAFQAAGQSAAAACQAAIAAAMAANGGVRPPRGGECNNIQPPKSPYYFGF